MEYFNLDVDFQSLVEQSMTLCKTVDDGQDCEVCPNKFVCDQLLVYFE